MLPVHSQRLYYRDSVLLDFTARVVRVTTHAGKPAVELDQTAFYPTSGGQPFDTGTLGDARVVEVLDLDGKVLHVIDGAVPAVGAEVVGKVDAARRVDHLQQHTGQHLLSQAFEQTSGFRTVSFHLGAEASTIDLDTPRLSPEEVRAAEELANRVVLEDRSILIHFAASDDVERFGLRKPTERTGEVRIVEVEGFDRSACGGTHARRTGEVGPIKVRRWERRGETSRVEFVCGWRALRDYAHRVDATRTLAERLSVKDTDLVDAVGRALDERERLRDANAEMQARLLELEARELLASARELPGPARRLVARVFDGRAPDELKRLALNLTRAEGTIALLGSRGERPQVVFAQSPGLPADLGAILRQVGPPAGVRGGGSHDLAQGGGPPIADVEAAVEAAAAMLASPPDSIS
jgi:alanyl-tRNA synthetase